MEVDLAAKAYKRARNKEIISMIVKAVARVHSQFTEIKN